MTIVQLAFDIVSIHSSSPLRARMHHAARLLCICQGTMVLCLTPAHASADSSELPMRICIAVAPLATIVEHIGGVHVRVDTLLPPGQDPHLFEPEPRLLYRLSQAQMYLLSGLPFEQILVQKLSAQQKNLRIIDLTTEISFLEEGSYRDAHDCSHDHAADHGHSGRDPHFWLGTHQLRQFINAAAHGIIAADPEHAATYQQNTARLLARLEAVHARNLTLLSPYRSRIFFVYHPAFAYFAHTYSLQQQAIETNGRQPGPRSIGALIKQARAAGVRTIFVQPHVDTKSAQTIADALHSTVQTIDPLSKDAIQNLETMARAIAHSFNNEPVQR
jgi:zinc transport system substrate-binding protein